MEKGKREQALKSLYWLRPDPNGVEGEMASIQGAIDEAKVGFRLSSWHWYCAYALLVGEFG